MSLFVGLVGAPGAGTTTCAAAIPNALVLYGGIEELDAHLAQPAGSVVHQVVFCVGPSTAEFCAQLHARKVFVVRVVRMASCPDPSDAWADHVDATMINNDTIEALQTCVRNVVQQQLPVRSRRKR